MKNYLVYTTLTTWNEPPRSRHQVTNVLKKEGVVYFVERSRIGLPKITVTKREEGVYTITPYHPVDYRVRYRTPLLNEWYHGWLLQQIKRLGISFEVVFTFDHTSYQINRFFTNVVYYCGDDFIGTGNFNVLWINAFHRRIERKLAAGAKMVVVTSEYLFERHKAFNSNTHIVPLGAPTVDEQPHYKAPENRLPTLGIVAFLNERMPLELFDGLLKKFKILMIGPADSHITARYAANTNAVFTGPKNGKALYKILEEVDVCIAPYAEQRINKGLTPNKLWLYLALGKPSIVTDIPNIKNWNFEPGVLHKCSNAQFGAICEKAYAENSETLFYKRIAVAKENSWQNRVHTILSLYDAGQPA